MVRQERADAVLPARRDGADRVAGREVAEHLGDVGDEVVRHLVGRLGGAVRGPVPLGDGAFEEVLEGGQLVVEAVAVDGAVRRVDGALGAHHDPPRELGRPAPAQERERVEGRGDLGHEVVVGVGERPVDVEHEGLDAGDVEGHAEGGRRKAEGGRWKGAHPAPSAPGAGWRGRPGVVHGAWSDRPAHPTIPHAAPSLRGVQEGDSSPAALLVPDTASRVPTGASGGAEPFRRHPARAAPSPIPHPPSPIPHPPSPISLSPKAHEGRRAGRLVCRLLTPSTA